MTNIIFKMDKDAKGVPTKLTMEIDLTVKGNPSKSEKSMVIASTHGNIVVEGTDIKLGVNMYRPK